MTKKRKLILALGILLIVVSGGSMLRAYLEQKHSEDLYSQLAQEAQTEAETEAETAAAEEETQAAYVSPIDFQRLWQINPQVVGWLKIPDTAVDYPILHDPESNDTYLYTDIEGNESAAGSIYLDCDNKGDFSDLHNVIYGHHMKNGTMFKDIMNFRDQAFLESHPTVMIYLPDREIELRAYACLYTTPDGIRRMTQFDSVEALREYEQQMTEGAASRVEPDQEINRLFSFVTCSYEFDDARTILYCYQVDAGQE